TEERLSPSARGAALVVGLGLAFSVLFLAHTPVKLPRTQRAVALSRPDLTDHLVATAAVQERLTAAVPAPFPAPVAVSPPPPSRPAKHHSSSSRAPSSGYLGRFMVTCYALGGTTATGRHVSTGV